MTVGGISMTRAAVTTSGLTNSNSEIWYVPNPSGTTANIVATFATAVNGVTIEVYSLIGYISNPISSAIGTTSASQSYNNKQVALAAGSRTVNVSTSLSNMVNDFSSACGASLWGVHASQALRGDNQTLTTTISPTSNNPKIALAIWSTQPCANSGTAAAFLARTSGLDNTHINAYTALLNGLDSDAITCKLDFLHVYATQDSTTALLNLVANRYNGTAFGPPVFTVDRGFQGVQTSLTVYIDTNFNPFTAIAPQFSANSAHMSVWNVADVGTTGVPAIGYVTSGISEVDMYVRFTDGNTYFRPMTLGSGAIFATASGAGYWISNRSASNAIQGYRNGSSVATASDASAGLGNSTIITLGYSGAGVPQGAAYQEAAASAGSSLSATDASNLNSRLRTYMTAVGVP